MKTPGNASSVPKKPHQWRFFRSGGFDQVRLDRGIDIAALPQFDQKLWAALACPVKGIEFDARTLALLDIDADGRIRAPEIIEAVQWVTALLNNSDELTKRSSAMPLSAINLRHAEGAKLLASAKQILSNLGKSDASEITPEDTADTAKIFANTRFNGDGIIPEDAADDDFTKRVIKEIIDCYGPETDRSGKPGISTEKIDIFFNHARAYSDWWAEVHKNPAGILPFGEATEKAGFYFERVQEKIDDYFTRCRLAKFDHRANAHLNGSEKELEAIARTTLSATAEEIASFPLAFINGDKPLPLTTGINPAWEQTIAEFQSTVVMPLYGSVIELTLEQWRSIRTKFTLYEKWKLNKPQVPVAKLGRERVDAIINNSTQSVLAILIAKDKALEQEANSIVAVERLTLFYCHLHQFLNNYVAFTDFYTRKGKAIFQIGTLYIDGRACELCTYVEDMAKHSALATLSKVYIAYCECRRTGSSEKMMIAAGITGGDADNLLVGRNGLFYDRQGRDWDATVVKIIEHPISIRQAFWSPYKRLGRMIREQIEKVASARDKANQDKTATGLSAAEATLTGNKVTPPAPFDVAKFAGIFAAIGLAIGAIGTAMAAVLTSFVSLVWWQMPLAFVGILFSISIPSMVIAALNLRQRNLAPLLDAGGWGVNTRAKINIPFGGALTGLAQIPKGSVRSATDPYAEKQTPWKFYIVVLIILGATGYWFKGELIQWYDQIRSSLVERVTAP